MRQAGEMKELGRMMQEFQDAFLTEQVKGIRCSQMWISTSRLGTAEQLCSAFFSVRQEVNPQKRAPASRN